jgi:Glycosyltransferase family 87
MPIITEPLSIVDNSRTGVLPSTRPLRVLILAILTVMAAVSTWVGIKEAASSDPGTEGIDFQWSGAHLLSQHEDPWKLYINHQDKGKIIGGQQPNYLAELMLLLQPLGRMPFTLAVKWWCALNLAFAASSLYILRKMFALDRDHTLLVMLLLMASMPFRVTLHNGQHSLFVLLMLCLTFFPRNQIVKGIALGLSYCKYSFSPLIVVMLLVKRKLGVLLISIFPPLLGLLVAWHILGGDLRSLALEPFEVAKIAVGLGACDIMTQLETLLRAFGMSSDLRFSISAMFGLIAATISAIWIGRDQQMDDKLQLAVALVFTLLCLKHVNYDFVVLIVPVAAAVMAPRSPARTIVLLCAVFFWFVMPIIQRILPGADSPKDFIYSLILLSMGIATARLYRSSSATNPKTTLFSNRKTVHPTS